MLNSKKINLIMGFVLVALIGLAFGLLSHTLALNLNSTYLLDYSPLVYRNPVLPSAGTGGPSLKNTIQVETSMLTPGSGSGGGPKLAFDSNGGGGPRLKNTIQIETSMLTPGSHGGGPKLAFGLGGGGPRLKNTIQTETSILAPESHNGGGPKLAFGAGSGGPRFVFGFVGGSPNKRMEQPFTNQSPMMLMQGGGGGPRLKNAIQVETSMLTPDSHNGGGPKLAFGHGSGGPKRTSVDGVICTANIDTPLSQYSAGGDLPNLSLFGSGGGGPNRGIVPGMGGGPKRASTDGAQKALLCLLDHEDSQMKWTLASSDIEATCKDYTNTTRRQYGASNDRPN